MPDGNELIDQKFLVKSDFAPPLNEARRYMVHRTL